MADSIFTSNEGYSDVRTHARAGTQNTHGMHTLARVAVCAIAAPPTQLLSRECTGPSNSERESEQKREIQARAGEKGMGKERKRERDGREGEPESINK